MDAAGATPPMHKISTSHVLWDKILVQTLGHVHQKLVVPMFIVKLMGKAVISKESM